MNDGVIDRTRVPARLREYYNDILRWPALANSWIWRGWLKFFPRRADEPVLLNLGAGKDYRRGWINVDVNLFYKRDMWLDLRNPLPFSEGTVDGIFTSHVLEHFPLDDAAHLVRECHRVLRRGGVLRIVVPDVEPAIQAYVRGDREYFRGRGQSLGRLFSDHVLDNSNHRLLIDFSFLEELLHDSGFQDVRRVAFREGSVPLSQKLAELDNRPEISLYAEAIR